MTVADRIRNKRIEMGFSQSELAVRAGYSDKTAISKIENSGNEITMKQVRRIAKALDTTDVYLMGWTEAVEQVSKEIERQMKPITDFFESHELDVPSGLKKEIDKLAQEYEPREILRAFRFLRAYLESSPERQQIVLDILQSHQGGS